MRKCEVTERYWDQPKNGSSITKGEWKAKVPVPGIFHQFITESNGDEHITMAVVEYEHGYVATVPLSWIRLLPYESSPEACVLEASPMIDTDHIKVCVEEALISFQTMCRDIANQVRG